MEVQKFLDRNDNSTKMAGTCWSHILDMISDVTTNLDTDPDSWYRGDDMLDKLNDVQ